MSGIPILVREYKYDAVINEVMLTSMHPGITGNSLWDLPADYQTENGPDYSQWYMH